MLNPTTEIISDKFNILNLSNRDHQEDIMLYDMIRNITAKQKYMKNIYINRYKRLHVFDIILDTLNILINMY